MNRTTAEKSPFLFRRELELYQKVIYSFLRQKGIILMSIIFPIIFLVVGWYTGNSEQLAFSINNSILKGTTREISVVTLSLVSGAFLGVFLSFYIFLTTRYLDFRLHQIGYSKLQIFVSKIVTISLLLIPASVITFLLAVLFVKIHNIFFALVAFILGTFIYALIGVFISFLAKNKLQATYASLILVVLDLGFLEAPLWSEVYNKWFMSLLPGYYPSKLLLESSFSSSIISLDSIGYSIIYILFLLLIISLISKIKKF